MAATPHSKKSVKVAGIHHGILFTEDETGRLQASQESLKNAKKLIEKHTKAGDLVGLECSKSEMAMFREVGKLFAAKTPLEYEPPEKLPTIFKANLSIVQHLLLRGERNTALRVCEAPLFSYNLMKYVEKSGRKMAPLMSEHLTTNRYKINFWIDTSSELSETQKNVLKHYRNYFTFPLQDKSAAQGVRRFLNAGKPLSLALVGIGHRGEVINKLRKEGIEVEDVGDLQLKLHPHDLWLAEQYREIHRKKELEKRTFKEKQMPKSKLPR